MKGYVLVPQSRTNSVCVCVCVCVCRDRQGSSLIDYKRMAHVTMEAEKSHDLPSVRFEAQESWWCSSCSKLKTREPGEPMVWVLVWVQRPKCQELRYVRTGEGGQPSSGESRFTLPLSISTPYVLKKCPPGWRGPSSSLSLWIQMLTSSRNSLTDTHSSNILLAVQSNQFDTSDGYCHL